MLETTAGISWSDGLIKADLNGDAVLDACGAEVRIRQLQLAVALRDVIRNGLELSLNLLHQPAVGVLFKDGLPVVAQRNL